MKLISLIVLSFIFAATVLAQIASSSAAKSANPDLTGVWMLETTTRSPKERTAADTKPVIMVLTYQEPELKVKKIIFIAQKPIAQERIFYTDNRGESFKMSESRPKPARPIPVTMKSKTKWLGDRKLYIETNITLDAPVGVLKRRMFEEWAISDDGQTLMRTIRFINDNENQAFEYGDVEPSRTEDWTETYRLIPPNEINKLLKGN